MSKDKKTTINVQGTAITILSQREEDYISLTDMVKHFPQFNSLEFDGIRNEAGRNSFSCPPRNGLKAVDSERSGYNE